MAQDNVSIGVTVGLGVFKTIATAYDIVTLPIYSIFQRPWVKRQSKRKIRARQEDPSDPYSAWVKVFKPPAHPILEEDTVDALFSRSVRNNPSHNCIGSRKVFGEEDEKQADGKVFRKFIQDDKFTWLSYKETNERIINLSRGLHALGLKRGDSVMIFAETRMEWFLSAMAAFRIGASISTLYATLGLDGLQHGINETEISYLITTHDLLPKINKIISNLPKLKHIVYIEGPNKSVSKLEWGDIKLVPLSILEEQGKQSKLTVEPGVIKPDDTAVVMYTSGSTGVPKGVIITHRNLMATIRGFYAVAYSLDEKEIYMAYLPLAHVLELAAECFFLSMSIPIGYSTPHTMTDKSTAVRRGCSGDAVLLKPTIMASVPLVLDRIRKAVMEKVEAKGIFFKELFSFFVQYKRFWTNWGFGTPIVNLFLCREIKKILGGKVKYIVSGSAPLSPDTHEFIRNVMDVVLIQGYGLTETAAGSTLMDFDDFSVGRAGAPLYGLKIKLTDWVEGNYHPTDKPNPRGEIIVGGDCVTAGYFRNDGLTSEFYKQSNGTHWFYTGDIGEIYPDGTVKLIDRKKDLVKLQYGEYISLGKVETELKTCPVVDNICVYGDSLHDYLIAIVAPNEKALRNLAKQYNRENMTHSQLCKDPTIIEAVKKMFHERARNLNRTERPAKILLVDEEWTPDSGLVTAALKIRRRNIEARYIKDIDRLYKPNSNGAQSA